MIPFKFSPYRWTLILITEVSFNHRKVVLGWTANGFSW